MSYDMRTPNTVTSMLHAAKYLSPLYAYNDALLEHLADPGSLHYYMGRLGLLAKFKVGEHNICVDELSNYTNAMHNYGFFNSDNSWTTTKFIAHYGNYTVNPLIIDFKSYGDDISVNAYSSHSSSRHSNLIYEPEAFDIIKSELVIRLGKLRRFGLLFDTMVEFGFEFVGFNSVYNFFLFDGVPYVIYLLPHSATFQFDSSCVVNKPEIILGDVSDHWASVRPVPKPTTVPLKPTAAASMISKKTFDIDTGDSVVIWNDVFKNSPDQRSWLRMHGSISKRAICNRLSDIVAEHAINVKYGSSPSWY